MMNFDLGLTAAPVTPLNKNGEVNFAIIDKYIDVLLAQGIRSVYLNGCTGEGPSFTVEERKRIAEEWVEKGQNKLDKIIIQVGGTNMKDSQELAIHAEKIGASAIASLPHLFYTSDVSGLVEYCRELTSVVPNMPFMYYHIPDFTGVHVNVEEFLRAAGSKIPNLLGVKYSHNDLLDATQCMLIGDGRYLVSLGTDELVLSSLVLGFKSSIGSTYNYCGKVNCSIVEAFNNNDMILARKHQLEAHKYLKIFMKHGGNVVVVTKAFLILLGLDVGPPRLPLMPLNDEQMQSLKQDLQVAGFFDSK